MPDKHLHIVSFTIPYPPNYGGVIDVFYKLKALHKSGIKIHLHCFEYDRQPAIELEKYCETIHYYKRKTSLFFAFSNIPYIVISRKSEELITNLLNDDYPILFEGLHTCYYLNDKRFISRKKIYRESNIEHHYYYNLFKAERNVLKKLYYLAASFKLKMYEKNLKHADLMLVVSQKDTDYLKKRFKENNIHYLPSFHTNEKVISKSGTGNYVLYHGNLSVAENSKAAEYLITEVFNNLGFKLVIAGLNPPDHLKRMANGNRNISFVDNPSDEEMFNLIQNAQVNILITFQATGLKLKLLNTLYQGRFTLVNKMMLNGTGLDDLCFVANDSIQLKRKLNELFEKSFDKENLHERKKTLASLYSNDENAKLLIKYIF